MSNFFLAVFTFAPVLLQSGFEFSPALMVGSCYSCESIVGLGLASHRDEGQSGSGLVECFLVPKQVGEQRATCWDCHCLVGIVTSEYCYPVVEGGHRLYNVALLEGFLER